MSGTGKSARQENETRDASRKESKTEGTINFDVPNIRNINYQVESGCQDIGAFQWKLEVKMETSERTDNVKALSVFLHCNSGSDSNLWSCEAEVEFKLHNYKDESQELTKTMQHKFDFNSSQQGYTSFAKWTDFQDEEKGYIQNNKISISAHIIISKCKGVITTDSFEFLSPNPQNMDEDCVLMIEDKKVYVSKLYLSLYSSYFSSLFYGEFKEKDMNEITLNHVTVEEFLELLHVIYPSHKEISVVNVDSLLKLGDRFDIQYVMKECEQFLLTNLLAANMIPLIQRITWADKYGLSRLQDSCLKELKSAAYVKHLRNSDGFNNLSDTTKIAILEKMIKTL